MGFKRKIGLPGTKSCGICGKLSKGESGLTDHLYMAHGLGIGRNRFLNNINKGKMNEKNSRKSQDAC